MYDFKIIETSPVVQGLRLHTPNAGGPGSIPGQETTPRTAAKDSACHHHYSVQANKHTS